MRVRLRVKLRVSVRGEGDVEGEGKFELPAQVTAQLSSWTKFFQNKLKHFKVKGPIPFRPQANKIKKLSSTAKLAVSNFRP